MTSRAPISLWLLLIAFALPNAHAECLRESSGQTVCGAGPCATARSGQIFCAAERYGAAVRDRQGEVVCGLGQCIKDIYGQIMCSSEPGGDVFKGIDGVKCVGGCEPATPEHCERVILE